jgi:hypothetical protein
LDLAIARVFADGVLRHRGVIDHHHCIAAADELVRLNEQFRL